MRGTKIKATVVLVAMLLSLLMPAGVRASDQRTEVENFVKRLYTLVLGRECDSDGLKFWTDDLLEGRNTGICVAGQFFESPEYTSRKRSDDEYIEDLYTAVLGRDSEKDGRAYWVDVLAADTKTEGAAKARLNIFGGFANSAEFTSICESYGIVRGDFINGVDITTTARVNLFVQRLYTIVLGRSCDTEGMTFWTTALINKEMTGKKVAGEFFLSKEYGDKNVTDEKYIDDLYRTLMDRPGDSSGISFWENELSNGQTRQSIFYGFSDSPEFLGICESFGIDRGEVEKKAKGKVVCIDPGHSSVVAPGVVPLGPGSSSMKAADAAGTYGRWSGLKEYELNLIIANQLKAELESRGYEVIMTRYDNTTPVDCVTRAQIANDGADINIRIHADALSSASANGAVAICITPNNPWNPQTYQGSRALADCLISNYCSATGIRNRGVSEQDDMTGNNWSTVPCVLFEMGFMTNESDDLKMADSDFQKSMVKGLADGIDAYFA